MLNILVHDYFGMNLDEVWLAVERDVPQLRQQVRAIPEDCFLVRTVWIEPDSERRRMLNPRKAYPVDPGPIPVFDRSGRANTGHALETAVLIELERRGMSVTYVRTAEGHEVDFLARSAAAVPRGIRAQPAYEWMLT